MNDLKTIYDAIMTKQPRYNKLAAYMSGDQPTTYLTERLRAIFRNVTANFTANWCSVVINSVDERINMTGFESDLAPAESALVAAWERNQMALEAADIHADALVFGEAYAMVWPGENGKAEVYYNDPRMVHILYAADNPHQVTLSGKMWTGDDGLAKMTLYYPDRLEYYTSSVKAENVTSWEAYEPDLAVSSTGKAANPYGQVPVFQFRTDRHCTSELDNVIPLQNGINKLLADMMVAAEYGAYNQRWVISQSDTTGLKNAPGEVWNLPAGDGVGQGTQVGQFESTDLKNYLDAVDRLSMTIGVITRTPKHYFFSQGGDPSGEALIALESPLNKKAQRRIDRFYPVWKQIGLFICQVEGVSVSGDNISPQFDRPETIQPKTEAEIVKLNVDAGMPLDTALSVSGWTDSEIETMNAVKDDQATAAQTSLAGALMKAERDMKGQAMPLPLTQERNSPQPPLQQVEREGMKA